MQSVQTATSWPGRAGRSRPYSRGLTATLTVVTAKRELTHEDLMEGGIGRQLEELDAAAQLCDPLAFRNVDQGYLRADPGGVADELDALLWHRRQQADRQSVV